MNKCFRCATRYPMALDVQLRWRDGDATLKATGITADVSANGLLVMSAASFGKGTRVKCHLALPLEVTKVPSILVCQGMVVRSSGLEWGSLSAVTIEDYEIQPEDGEPAYTRRGRAAGA